MIHSVKIFLVDDDLFALNKYRYSLENCGYLNITLFLNGSICLNNLNQKPNIIFLNHPIDDSLGFSILKKIKQSQPTTYVIILLDPENSNMAVDAIKHGAFECIIKGDNELIKMKNVIKRVFSLKKQLP